MLPTHVLIGAVFASLTVFVAPEHAMVALAAAVMGSILPDLDMVFQHRRTFHYPLYYSVLAGALLLAAVVYPSDATVFAAFFTAGAAIHSVSDIFGGGLGLRPWEANDDRGVYYHYGNRWIPPKRWVPYDGSPHDFVVDVVLVIPLLLLYDGLIQQVLYIVLGISAVYVLVRKKMVEIAPERFR